MLDNSHVIWKRNSTQYTPAGTKTFRRGSRQWFKNWKQEFGTNLQNIEKSIRSIYYADEGKMFCQVDQAGADAFIVAILAGPGKYRELFVNKIKPHVYLALPFYDQWEKACPYIHDLRKLKISELKSHPNWKEFDSIVQASDNNPPATRYYYHYKQTCHCVDSETEVLTKQGWLKITKSNQKEIAVWNLNTKQITFEMPSEFHVGEFSGNMLHFTSNQLDQLVTPNHNIIYQSNNKHFKKLASSVPTDYRVPLSGNYVGGQEDISPLEAQLIAAIQADGYIASSSTVIFRFKKQRKIERLMSILKKLNIVPQSNTNYDLGITAISVKNIDKYILVFQGKKQWDFWLLSWSKESLKSLVEELSFWDGSWISEYLHKREDYCSSIKQNVEWMKTILHLVDKQGTILEEQKKGYSPTWKMGINKRQYARINCKKLVPYIGQVYCYTVSTGAFLIRRNGKISITSNSANYGIRADTFRFNVLLKSGGKVNLSKFQADRYLSEYRVTFPEIDRVFQGFVRKQLQEKKMLRTLQSFPLPVCTGLNYVGEEDLQEWYAKIPQATVGIITAECITDFQYYVMDNKLDWDFMQDGHDAMLVQAPIDQILNCAKKAKEFMERELKSPYGETFRMRSGVSIGKNWSSFNEIKNPDGLKEISL